MALQKPTMNPKSKRWMGVLVMVAVAFFASYAFAAAKTGGTPKNPAAAVASVGDTVGTTGTSGITDQAAGTLSTAGGGTSGDTGQPLNTAGASCACCGGGAAQGPATTGTAKVEGDVQKIAVDLSKGYYDPSTIELAAGVPAEITFGQSSGCTGAVQSQTLGFYEDLTSGAKTVKLPALQPGTYQFTCGMQMVSGTIVVK